MNRRISSTAALVAALILGGLLPATAKPAPDPTSFTEMAQAYHCGPYFHGHTIRGFLIQRVSSTGATYVHVTSGIRVSALTWTCQK